MGSCARFRVVTFASPSLEESVSGLSSKADGDSFTQGGDVLA